MYGRRPYQVLLMSRTKKLTLCAIFTALGVVMLYLGCFFQTIDMSICAIASLIIVIVTLEFGAKTAFMVYIATSALSLLLLPAKYIATLYAVFIGYYPLLKNVFERLPKALAWFLKILVTNIALAIMLLLGTYVFKLDDTLNLPIIAATVVLANLCIVFFDILLDRLIILYHIKFRKMLGIAKIMRPK